jgi:hypothetical protein
MNALALRPYIRSRIAYMHFTAPSHADIFYRTPAAGTRQHYNLFVMNKTFYVLTCALCTLLVLPAAAQVPSYVPTDGLVGWWPFNGNANDESGNGNDGVVNGATLVNDRAEVPNSAYSFNSSASNFIQMSLPVANEVTICGWYKCDTPNRYYPRIFYYGSNSSQSSPATMISAGIMGNEPSWLANYTGRFYNETNVSASAINHNTITSDNLWHHFSVSMGTDGIISTYIDGQFAMSNALMSAVNISNGQFFIGRDPNDDYGGFGLGRYNGILDDFAFFNRELSAQEIQNLYTGTTPPPCVSLPSNLQQGLVGYWPFCGNANDESGNGNDGVVNGATLTEDRFGNAGKAYAFDGETDFIEIQDNNSLDLTNQYSFSAWVEIPDYSLNNSAYSQRTILGKPRPNGGSGYSLIALIGNESPGLNTLAYAAGWNDDNSNGSIAPVDSIPLDSWTHIVFTNDGTVAKLFKNGIETATADFNLTLLNSDQPLYIGKEFNFNNSADNRWFNGSLDDIGIWNRALTPEEVQELYTLDACTFSVYDTLTVYETVFDTVYTYETIYDTVTTYVTVTDTLLIDITITGFEGQPSWLNTVTVFPNPASDHITIDYGNFALMAGYNTIITDAAGATVYSSAVNSQQVDIDINAWGAMGVYYMSVYDASGALVAVRHIVLE